MGLVILTGSYYRKYLKMNNMQKVKRWECKPFLKWVKSLPSCVDMGESGDAHHLKSVIYTGTTKPHDLFVIPLNREQHTGFHDVGKTQWERQMGTRQAEECVKTISKAIDEGLIEIKWVGE